MTIVKLKYDDKEVITTAENYIRYSIFDVQFSNGDTWPVHKEDTVLIDIEEIQNRKEKIRIENLKKRLDKVYHL